MMTTRACELLLTISFGKEKGGGRRGMIGEIAPRSGYLIPTCVQRTNIYWNSKPFRRSLNFYHFYSSAHRLV
jgi:hypothetical protein